MGSADNVCQAGLKNITLSHYHIDLSDENVHLGDKFHIQKCFISFLPLPFRDWGLGWGVKEGIEWGEVEVGYEVGT